MESSCTVSMAQLLGAWRTVVSPFTEVHTEEAPEKAHPCRGSS